MVDKFTLILCQFAPRDYPESNWQEIYTIENEDDLLEALKDGYLRDAHTRNDYPVCSFDLRNIYTYENLSEYNHTGSIHHRDLRYMGSDDGLEFLVKEQYSDTFNKFNKWKLKIKTLIPRIRMIANEQEKTNREMIQLFELAKKYGYNLHKEI